MSVEIFHNKKRKFQLNHKTELFNKIQDRVIKQVSKMFANKIKRFTVFAFIKTWTVLTLSKGHSGRLFLLKCRKG